MISEIKERLTKILEGIEAQLLDEQIPNLRIKSRKKDNLYYSEGFWLLNDQKFVKKTLKTKGGSKELLKIVHTIVFVLQQLEQKKTSTLREFYYQALNWIDEARFQKINDSNLCLENLQIILELIREDFNIFPEAEGKIAGPVKVSFKTRSGEYKTVDCTEGVASNGFLLPRSLNEFQIVQCKAKFMLVIETGGMFSRLIEQNFDKKYSCLLVLTGGHSSRMTRKFIKKMNNEYNLKAAIYTDGDFHGIKIARSIIEGAVKSSHLSDQLCTPDSVHIGLFPSQIEQYKLPTDTITKLEKEGLIAMKTDFRYDSNPDLMNQIEIMLSTEKKAEQQALSYHGLTFVTQQYLPKVLKKYGFIN